MNGYDDIIDTMDEDFQHQLIKVINNLCGKFKTFDNITIFDYFMAGGSNDIDRTIDVIDRLELSAKYRQIKILRGKLNSFVNMSRYTCTIDESTIRYDIVVQGHQLTDHEKHNILRYMRDNDFPLSQILFNQIAKEYLLGNIDIR